MNLDDCTYNNVLCNMEVNDVDVLHRMNNKVSYLYIIWGVLPSRDVAYESTWCSGVSILRGSVFFFGNWLKRLNFLPKHMLV